LTWRTDWISTAASADVARLFVRAVLDHIDEIVTFPFAGRARDDVRPGMRVTTLRKRAVIAYVVDEDSDGRRITVWASSTAARTGSAPSRSRAKLIDGEHARRVPDLDSS